MYKIELDNIVYEIKARSYELAHLEAVRIHLKNGGGL